MATILFFELYESVKVLVTNSYLNLCDPWTVAHQDTLSMEFSREEYWSGYPFTFPEDLHDPGIKAGSPTLQADSLSSEPPFQVHLGDKDSHLAYVQCCL